MLSELSITRIGHSRLDTVDFENLGFGDVFSDHMFLMFHDGHHWGKPEVRPYGPLPIEPGNAALHYGQAVFEGLKAFRGTDGRVRVFRPDMNVRRLQTSCERLCIPPVDETAFYAAIDALVSLDHQWIPTRRGQALYIRPLIFSAENHLEVRPSRRFQFVVMTAPVRAYFDSSAAAVSLKVEEEFTRAAPGGMGYAKTAGNYAASLYPGDLGRQQGHAQVLWLDGLEHRYVEEVGAMNIFFRIDGKVVTPELRGTILAGVTRDSVLTLLREMGETVEERRIAIDELVAAIHSGALTEAFGAGTAAIIAPVGQIAYRGTAYTINQNQTGSLTQSLYDAITSIQFGERPDQWGWNRLVETDTRLPKTA